MEDKQIRKLISMCEDVHQEGDSTCLYFCQVYSDVAQDNELDNFCIRNTDLSEYPDGDWRAQAEKFAVDYARDILIENKKLFVAKLFEAIKLCSNARGLVSLEYHEHLTQEEAGEKARLDGFRMPGEYVVATFDDGYQNFIFVGGDSCWGIYYDLDRYLF